MPPDNDLELLSMAEFHEQHGEPESYPVRRLDRQPLAPGVPVTATVPLSMGKKAAEFTMQDANIILSDFGESFIPTEEIRTGRDCHTPVDFRPPEAIFEPDTGLSSSSDIWSLAAAIWDIVGMQSLFSSAFYDDEEVMCQIVDCLGPLPTTWSEKWEHRTDFFDDEGRPVQDRHVWEGMRDAFAERVQRFRREDGMEEFCPEEEKAFLDMIARMLRYRPEERPDIQGVLQSDWMMKWAHLDKGMGDNP